MVFSWDELVENFVNSTSLLANCWSNHGFGLLRNFHQSFILTTIFAKDFLQSPPSLSAFQLSQQSPQLSQRILQLSQRSLQLSHWKELDGKLSLAPFSWPLAPFSRPLASLLSPSFAYDSPPPDVSARLSIVPLGLPPSLLELFSERSFDSERPIP